MDQGSRPHPVVAGFDIGTHRIAIGVPELGHHYEEDFTKLGKKWGRDHELMEMRSWVRKRLRDYREVIGYVEQPFVSTGHASNPTVTIGMSETVGIIRSSVDWAKPCTMVAPTAWKKALTGKGDATKELVRDWLLWDSEHQEASPAWSQDLIDSYCIGIYGRMVEDGRIELPAKRSKRRARQGD